MRRGMAYHRRYVVDIHLYVTNPRWHGGHGIVVWAVVVVFGVTGRGVHGGDGGDISSSCTMAMCYIKQANSARRSAPRPGGVAGAGTCHQSWCSWRHARAVRKPSWTVARRRTVIVGGGGRALAGDARRRAVHAIHVFMTS